MWYDFQLYFISKETTLFGSNFRVKNKKTKKEHGSLRCVNNTPQTHS